MKNATPLETVDVVEDFNDDGGYCWKCNGQGFIIVCCDDLCHGQGYCMHGDGEVMCMFCQGEG